MSFRTTMLLFGLLLGILWSFGLVLSFKRSSLDQGFVFPKFAQDKESEVNSVEIHRDKQTLAFTKSDNGSWYLNVPPHKQKVKIPTNKVRELIDEIQGARHSNPETDVTRDTSLFQLDKPPVTVTMKTTNGGELKFNVGKISGDNAYAYCNSSERPTDVLAVRRSAISSVFLEPDKFRSTTLIDEKAPPTGIAIKETDPTGKATELALAKTKNKYWKFVQPPLGPADFESSATLKNDKSLSGLIGTITGLMVEDFEPFDSPTDFDAKSARLRVELDYGADEEGKEKDKTKKQVLLVGGEVPGREKGKEQYYAKMDTEGADKSVVRISAKQLEPVFALVKDPSPLRSRDISQLDTKAVDAVEVWYDKDFYILHERKQNWLVFSSDKPQRVGNELAIEGDKSGLLFAIEGKGAINEKDLEDLGKPARLKELQDMFADPAKVKATVKVFADSIAPEPKKDEPKKDDTAKDEKKKDETKKEEPKYDPKKDKSPPQFKADAKPVVTLSFVPAEEEKMMVKREAPDSEPMYFKITKAVYEKIIPKEKALAFYDTDLSPFKAAEAVKFELARGSSKEKEDFLLVRDLPKPKDKEDDKKSEPKKDDPVKDLLKKDADDKDKKEGDPKDQKDAKKDNKKEPRPEDWKLVKPENFGKSEVDQLDVDMLLSRLGTLHAERWERQVGKDGLVQYGLDSPGIVVSVTTKTKEGDKEETKTTVLKVGNKSRDEKDKGGYYAIQEGSDFVFVIAGTLQKKLEEAEFRDRLVSKFESKDVKEVDMRILNEKGDFIHDPVAERDGDKGWKKKSGWGGDFDLDPARMDEMVAKMADFKCERYLNAKTPPPAEWKLEGKDVPYKIEFVMNDGKTKHWITIGARQKDEGSYYGMSSLRPGMVFLIPASQVETMMTGRMSWYSKK